MEYSTVSLVLLYLASIAAGLVVHTPKVKEDESDSTIERENLRSIRNPDESFVRIGYNPTKFNYQHAKQQDYLKQRYAQQQQINVEKIAEFRKNPLKKNVKEYFDEVDAKQEQSAHDRHSFRKHRQERSSENDKETDEIHLKNRSSKSTEKDDKVPDKHQINRQDDVGLGIGGHIIYLDPRILKQILDMKSKRTQIQSRSFDERPQEVDTNSLNELIGKNPHVQLESLKRILQQSHQTKFLPLIAGPAPFQNKDHTPITEKTIDIPNPKTRPNIQVAVDEDQSPKIPQTNQIVTKEAFEQIQKQLDEASKFQVHQALERAQQAAQAHVAAQHKAIERAQKAILENVQKSLNAQKFYDNPQALRLVQAKVPEFSTHLNVPVPQQAVYSTPLPPVVVSPVHDVTLPTAKVQVNSYKTAFTTAVPTVLHNTIVPEEDSHSTAENVVSEVPQLHKFRIIKVTPVSTQSPKQYIIQPQIKHVVVAQKPEQEFTVKNVEPYAPNHLHQTIEQLQAEKVLLQQIHSRNNAILNSNKQIHRYVGQKIPISSGNEEKEAQSSANAYQHLVFNTQRPEKVSKLYHNEENNEENDDLQYAAKYAFGYRIKDNKEGNDFGHEEKRSGRSAEGSYHVLLPDGRRQTVEYYADDNGYHAKVTYEEVGQHE